MTTQNPWKVCPQTGLAECRDPSNCRELVCADKYADDNFLPKRARPVAPYARLMVVPKPSKKQPDKAVAFIGRQLCFFENGTLVPPIDVPVEVMITRPLFHKSPRDDGESWTYNMNSVMALLLRVVTDEFALVDHGGFECSGSMCSTTARVYDENGKYVTWMTPGRTHVFEAGNVNAGSTWHQHYVALRPGKIWVPADWHKSSPVRAEGLARAEDASYVEATKCVTDENRERAIRHALEDMGGYSRRNYNSKIGM